MFITFEGIDGSGKTTQGQLLKEKLESLGYQVLLTREPGGTKVAEAIRGILLHLDEKIEAMTEVFLYCGARNEHLEKIILPALKKGYIVISDRYYHSTLAYQGFGRELGLAEMKAINSHFINTCPPDLTFFLDIGLEIFEKRLEGQELDRMEKEGLEFMTKVRQGYLEMAAEEKNRIQVIEGSAKIEDIAEKIYLKVKEVLDARS